MSMVTARAAMGSTGMTRKTKGPVKQLTARNYTSKNNVANAFYEKVHGKPCFRFKYDANGTQEVSTRATPAPTTRRPPRDAHHHVPGGMCACAERFGRRAGAGGGRRATQTHRSCPPTP